MKKNSSKLEKIELIELIEEPDTNAGDQLWIIWLNERDIPTHSFSKISELDL